MNPRRAILFFELLGLSFLIGCGLDLEQLKNEAQDALSVGNFSQAREISTRALEQGPGSDERLTWALERIRLEALARGGETADARDTLERMAGEYPSQVNASLYLAIASYLHEAGDAGGAIEILVAGDKRFPEESEKFKTQIQEFEASGLDPAEIDRLRSLGYL